MSLEEEYNSVKKQLKKWEACFYTTHEKKPGKDDMDNAPDGIKEAYKKYGDLKRRLASQQPKIAVWGSELNKKAAGNGGNHGNRNNNDTKKTSSVMSKIGQKLMSRANFKLQENSSTSLNKSWSRKGIESSRKVPSPEDKSSNTEFEADISFSSQTLDVSSPIESNGAKKPSFFEKALQLTQGKDSKVANSPKSNKLFHEKIDRTLPANIALQMSTKKSSLASKYSTLTPLPHTDSKEEFSKFEKENKIKEDLSMCEQPLSSANKFDIEPSQPFVDESVMEATTEKHNSSEHNLSADVSQEPSSQTIKNSPVKNTHSINKTSIFSKTGNSSLIIENVQMAAALKEVQVSMEEKMARKKEAKARKLEAKEKAIYYEFTGEAEVSEIMSQKPSGKRKAESEEDPPEKRRKRRKGAAQEEEEQGEEEEKNDVGWRPDSRCGEFPDDFNAPSDSNTDESETEEETPVPSAGRGRGYGGARSYSAPAKSVTDGNYVRINMKMKRYARGRGGMRGGRAKRMAWKEKMKARSESYGDKCFKCGQAGHWANKCPGNKKPGAGWGNESVAEEDFPSLKEAMQMARGIKIDKSKKNTVVKATTSSVGSKTPKGAEKVETVTAEKNNDAPENEKDEEDDADMEVVRSAFELPPPPPPIEPLYSLTNDGRIPPTPADVYEALGVFGYTTFRTGQEEAVMRILCGQSTLVVLSTGAGKSLCYQLPAYIYGVRRNALTLVISPLVSLMEDQVEGLPTGVIGACLHTNMSKPQREKVIASVNEGKVHFLLVSPEALVGGGQSGLVFSSLPPIGFACIDEAHCVSEWSHHFRPSYLRVCKVLRDKLGVQCMLGLTATATMTTAASVSRHLGIPDYATATIRGAPVPDNLQLSVSRDSHKDQALIELLQGDRFASCDSIIIYCTRREQTERCAKVIRTCLKDVIPPQKIDQDEDAEKKKTKKKGKGRKKERPAWDAEAYHAGLTAAKRKSVQKAFMTGQLRVVVATVAFGMGLDKSDVRAIIHYNLPKSYESYVQEIGRAGRDGKVSHCHVFLDDEGRDMSELKKHTYANTVDRHIIKKLVNRLFTRCRCKELHERHLQAMKECQFDDDGIDYSQLDTENPDQQQPHEKQDVIRQHPNEGEGHTEEEDSQATNCPQVAAPRKQICPGHERAIPIDSLVRQLDMKEEGISTLLCYLELHPKHWVENLTSVYATCKIHCYGGPMELQNISKKCPPVAVAIARQKKEGISHKNCKELEFNVVEISDSMGWESGPVKRELKLLQWDFNVPEGRGPRKTGVLVELSELAFHLRSPGDLTDDEIDEVVDFLTERLNTQEKTELAQLNRFYNTLLGVAHKDHWMCADKVDEARSQKLKSSILQHFDFQPTLEAGQVTELTFSREVTEDTNNKVSARSAEHARGDILSFIHLYGQDHSLSGRAIARIFYGIPSPNFPSEIWGRVRRFWRAHLNLDFNVLKDLATEILIRHK